MSTAIYQGVTVQGAPFTVTWVAVTVTCPGQDGVVLADGVRVNNYLFSLSASGSPQDGALSAALGLATVTV